MRHHSNSFIQSGLRAALMAISGLGGVVSAPTLVAAAGDEATPARLIELSGATAKELAAFPHAEPVLVTYTNEGWAAVLFSENPEDIPDLVKRLTVQNLEGPGCVAEGPVSCCNADGALVLHTERGWLRVGQRCKKAPHDEGVPVEQVPQALTQQLRDCCGIVDEYMDLANPDGSGRVLWNWPWVTPSESGELSLRPRVWTASEDPHTSSLVIPAETPTQIILAHGHSSSSCDAAEPDSCGEETSNRVCHEDERHWWVRMRTSPSPRWCRREPCRC
jgi:hypothetical protein